MGFLRTLFRQDNIEVGSFVFAVGTFGYVFSKNAYLANKYIQYNGKKDENGEPVPVNTLMKFRFESILQKFEFTEWNKGYISMYVNKYLDPNVIGSCNLRNGVRIGVPEYYQQVSDEGIKKSVTINESIDWESPAGKRFLESLKLGEFAQKYIIACNVAMSDGYYAIIDSVIGPFLILSAYSAGNRLYRRFKLHRRPFILTLFVFAVHLTSFTMLYLYLKDSLYTVYYKAAEEKVCEFGASYIKGSIDYYKKKIERNKALRELLKDGHKHYTEDGNEVGIWRVKGLLDTFKLIAATDRVSEYEILEEQRVVPTPNPNPHPIL